MLNTFLFLSLTLSVFSFETQPNIRFLESKDKDVIVIEKRIELKKDFNIHQIIDFTNGLIDGLELLKEIPDLELCENRSMEIASDITNLVEIIKTYSKDITKGTIDLFNCLSSIFNHINGLLTICRKLPDEFTKFLNDLKEYFSKPKDYIIKFTKNLAIHFLNFDELYIRMKVYYEELMFRKLGLSTGRLIKGVLLPDFLKNINK